MHRCDAVFGRTEHSRSDRVQYLSFRCDDWFGGKLHICCLQDGVLLQDVLLGLIVAKGLKSRDMEMTCG